MTSENVSKYASTNSSVSTPSVMSGPRCDGSLHETSGSWGRGHAGRTQGGGNRRTCGLTHGEIVRFVRVYVEWKSGLPAPVATIRRINAEKSTSPPVNSDEDRNRLAACRLCCLQTSLLTDSLLHVERPGQLPAAMARLLKAPCREASRNDSIEAEALSPIGRFAPKTVSQRTRDRSHSRRSRQRSISELRISGSRKSVKQLA